MVIICLASSCHNLAGRAKYKIQNMNLANQIEENLKIALKEKNTTALLTLRGLKSSIMNFKIEKGLDNVHDNDVIKLIKSEIKKRKDSIEAYIQGGRQELADKESDEIKILESFLPEQMSEEKIKNIVERIIKEMGEVTQKDIGKIIGNVIKEAGDAADGSLVSKIVKENPAIK